MLWGNNFYTHFSVWRELLLMSIWFLTLSVQVWGNYFNQIYAASMLVFQKVLLRTFYWFFTIWVKDHKSNPKKASETNVHFNKDSFYFIIFEDLLLQLTMKVHYPHENQLIVGRFFSDFALKRLKSPTRVGVFLIFQHQSWKKANNFSGIFLCWKPNTQLEKKCIKKVVAQYNI